MSKEGKCMQHENCTCHKTKPGLNLIFTLIDVRETRLLRIWTEVSGFVFADKC